MRKIASLIPLWLAIAMASHGQSALPAAVENADLVQRALATESKAAEDRSHPMRYQLRKTSPRLTTTKDLIETRDGAVARLLAVNDQPPSPPDLQKDDARLDALLRDPGKQRHRKQGEDEDTGRALKVLRALPTAFVYQYAGTVEDGSGHAVARFTFTPDPKFSPPDLETEVLTQMTGEIWIDPAQVRVEHLQAKLRQDVDFGWGVLGRLYKGGWVSIDQADVGGGSWRIVKFQMAMSARVLIRNKSFETTETETQYTPVPPGMDYKQAVEMLRGPQGAAGAKPGR
ncbi:MAG TPA: hypothetical protein VGJ21_23980 [Terracidiphilus sp.]